MTYHQKLEAIELLQSIRKERIPNYHLQARQLKNMLLKTMTGRVETIGRWVLVRMNTTPPYLQIYTKRSYQASQEFLQFKNK